MRWRRDRRNKHERALRSELLRKERSHGLSSQERKALNSCCSPSNPRVSPRTDRLSRRVSSHQRVHQTIYPTNMKISQEFSTIQELHRCCASSYVRQDSLEVSPTLPMNHSFEILNATTVGSTADLKSPLGQRSHLQSH